MCGRYTRVYSWKEVHDFLDLQWPAPEEMRPSWNVAPTQVAPIVRLRDGRREMVLAKWGLVPAWAKEPRMGGRLINARVEGVAEKPAFRGAFARRRCVAPASGFYEWQQCSDGKKPWLVQRADGEMMLFAALWERWERDGQSLETFAIITTPANEFMSAMHDRMPAILEPEQVATWLDPETPLPVAQSLLVPAADGVLQAHRVSPRVGSPKHDDPSLVEPAA